MKRLILILTIMAVGALVFAGPSAEESTTVAERPEGVLTVTVGMNTNVLSEAEVEAFEAANPNTKINQIAPDYNILLSSIAAGDPPDLFRTDHLRIPYFAVRGLLYPIDEYIDASEVISVDDFEFAVNTFRYDVDTYTAGEGPLYGLPKDYNLLFDFFYRKDVFEDAGVPFPSTTEPMDYSEFFEMVKQVTVHDGGRTIRWGYSGVLDELVDQALELLLAQVGESLYEDERLSKVDLVDNPEAVNVAKFIFELSKQRLTDSPLDPAEAWLGGNFAADEPRSAVYQYGYWAGAMYNEPEVVDKIGYAPGPIWGNGEWLNGGHVAGTMMFKAEEQYMNDEAWKFMEYYHAGGPAITRAKSGWGLPFQKSFRDMIPTVTELDRTRLNVTLDQLETGRYYVINGNPWALEPIKTVWNKHIGEALKETISFEEFLGRVEKETNDLIMDGMNTLGQ